MCGIVADDIEQAIQEFGGLFVVALGFDMSHGRGGPQCLPSRYQLLDVKDGIHFSSSDFGHIPHKSSRREYKGAVCRNG
jgi:hypothetical protein